ncbi:hypothetical protein O6H91_05G118000 [Diphasiastrum complanatum]|uniref:Uncharacterized protein n=1 Tax=Diphasiastrum complanatum TaxID=34168 RepID=A0ACC2DTD0_DIPCM|nr:hypothetical protein O6H91_05G118000 [Diphasiastrum complanatum]
MARLLLRLLSAALFLCFLAREPIAAFELGGSSQITNPRLELDATNTSLSSTTYDASQCTDSSLALIPVNLTSIIPASSLRRRLEYFHQCGSCTCCTDFTRQFCFERYCCYTITCFLPDLPFGLCRYVPITCECAGCN